jgi:staphylococcal nuclease domain-containing protein 1
VGKDIPFSVSYTISTMTPPREYGVVFLHGVNVLDQAVVEGWVKVRDGGKKDKTEEEENTVAKLKGLEEQAKAAGKGMWSSESGKVDVKHDLFGKEKEFLEKWKGKDVDGTQLSILLTIAIVEATPAADRLRARLLLPESPQQIIPIVLAGVRSHSASKKGVAEDIPDAPGQAEEFGDEARWFVESKLLQRSVKIEIMYHPYPLHLSFLLTWVVAALIRRGQCLLPRLNIQRVILRNFCF